VVLTRRRVVLLTASVLLALDLGRSLSARVGSATPTPLPSPAPAFAAPIAWPPGSDLPSDAPPGQRLYAEHCAICHGTDGRGNGPAAPALHPRPRNFTAGVFKYKSIPGARAPTRSDMRRIIARGMPGTAMPAWHDILSPEDDDAVGAYILRFGPYAEWTPEEGVANLPAEVWANASADAGRALYDQLGCASCHGTEGHGDGPSAAQLEDVWGQSDPPRDISAPWTFRGGDDPAALYARIAYGISGTPMPSYLEVATPVQIASVVTYIRSIARVPPWEPGGSLGGPGQSSDPLVRGKYLVDAGMCGLCHTPVDAHGIELAETHYLAGGMKIEAGGHGLFFTSNLTSDPATGVGSWTVEQIAVAIRTGHTPLRRLNFWGMPWMVLGMLTHEDASAIGAYLKTVPPVSNRIPAPLHYGLLETVVRKLGYAWPALVPDRLSYYPGNFGEAAAARWSRTTPQTALIWAQWCVAGLGLLAFAFTRRRPRPDDERSLGLTLLGGLFVVILIGASLVVYRYPAVRLLPPGPVIAALDAAVPPLPTGAYTPQAMALLQRGRYLYSTSSCAYCHNTDGGGGGKVNWSVFGTTWARNLTAHPTGLAEWSDEAVLRSLTSGVSRNGRAIHWQAMIWDHFSNYDLGDQHALLLYLRRLPPRDRTIPPTFPPQPGDCAGDTFWVGRTSFEPGCG
jgi:mono/diheme cytochrome c family protein